jgi:rhamnulokinase
MVAVDLGAGSCRVSLLTWPDGSPHVDLVHRFENAPVETAGGLRWSLDTIVNGVEAGLRKCADRVTSPVASIAVDGWGVDYVRLHDDGSPRADPFCYRDPRTVDAESTVNRALDRHVLYAATGVHQLRINTIYQLVADRSAGDGGQPWVQVPEYVTLRLGGRRVAERTNATHTGLVDLDGRWALPVFEQLQLDAAVAPPLVPPGTIVGHVTGPLATLPAFADCKLVVPACHDTASAVAGIPATGADDWAYLSSGTWSLVGAVLDKPCATPDAYTAGFTNLGAVGGRTLFHRNVNGLWLLEQCRGAWADAGHPWPVGDLVAAAESAPEIDGLIDVDDPDLLLPGDMPARINRQRDRKRLPPVSDPPTLARLIFRSLAARYAVVLREIAQLTARPLRRLFVVGGGSQNELLNRLTTEATGLAVHRAAVESSTVGNFAVQLAAVIDGATDAATVAKWATKLQNT